MSKKNNMETVNKFLELLNRNTLKTVKKENCETIHEVWNGLLGIDTMLKSENERHMAALSLNDMAKYCTDNKVSDYFSVTIFPLILKLHRFDKNIKTTRKSGLFFKNMLCMIFIIN